MNDLEQRELPGNTTRSSNRRSFQESARRGKVEAKENKRKGPGVAVGLLGYRSCLPEHFRNIVGLICGRESPINPIFIPHTAAI